MNRIYENLWRACATVGLVAFMAVATVAPRATAADGSTEAAFAAIFCGPNSQNMAICDQGTCGILNGSCHVNSIPNGSGGWKCCY